MFKRIVVLIVVACLCSLAAACNSATVSSGTFGQLLKEIRKANPSAEAEYKKLVVADEHHFLRDAVAGVDGAERSFVWFKNIEALCEDDGFFEKYDVHKLLQEAIDGSFRRQPDKAAEYGVHYLGFAECRADVRPGFSTYLLELADKLFDDAYLRKKGKAGPLDMFVLLSLPKYARQVDAMPVMVKVIRKSKIFPLRIVAVRAIREYKNAADIPFFVELTRSSDLNVVGSAFLALREFDKKKAMALAAEYVKNEKNDAKIRQYLAKHFLAQ